VTESRHLNTWLEVSRSAYARNLGFFRRLVGPAVELAAVVKSNAYGHGMELIAGLAAENGADSFCVHSLDEALRLRRAGFGQDVLIMGHVPVARLAEAVREDFRLVLYNRASARRLAELAAGAGRPVRVHLKIETGTYRQGIDDGELGWFLSFLGRRAGLRLDGVYTHFANIEDTTDHGYARHQLERFHRAVERLREAGLDPGRRHAACSAATLVFPGTHFEMVRLGISQYGLWPSKETLLSYNTAGLGRGSSQRRPSETADFLEPVLTWKARISQLKRVPAGRFVGYGCTWQTTRETRLAILPVGYADGYDRRLSNQAYVLVGGRRAPVRGRVCMNLVMVDVTDVPGVELEDEAVLFGRMGDQRITADQLAGLVGTIHYEITSRLAADLPRILVE
jgi:alanine racemase